MKILTSLLVCFVVVFSNCNQLESSTNIIENPTTGIIEKFIDLSLYGIEDQGKLRYTFTSDGKYLILLHNEKLLQIAIKNKKVVNSKKLENKKNYFLELISSNEEIGVLLFDSKLSYSTDIDKPMELIRFNNSLDLLDTVVFYYPKMNRVLEEDFNYKSYYIDQEKGKLVFNKKYLEIETIEDGLVMGIDGRNKIIDIKSGEIFTVDNSRGSYSVLMKNDKVIFDPEGDEGIKKIRFSDASIYDNCFIFNDGKSIVSYDVGKNTIRTIPFFDYDCSNRFDQGVYQLRNNKIKWVKIDASGQKSSE